MSRRKYRLKDLEVDRVDLVDKGANQYAEIVIAKSRDDKRESIAAKMKDGYPIDSQLKNGPPPNIRRKRKKGKKGKGSADAERNAAEVGSAAPPVAPPSEKPNPFAKHNGPGDHASGSSQDVHGKKGSRGGKKSSYTGKTGPNMVNFGDSDLGSSKTKTSSSGSARSNPYLNRRGGIPSNDLSRANEEDMWGDIVDNEPSKWEATPEERTLARRKDSPGDGIPGTLGYKSRMEAEAGAKKARKQADFDAWKRKVNSEVGSIVGLSADDLADQPYRDWHDDGVSPKAAAKRALRSEGFNAFSAKKEISPRNMPKETKVGRNFQRRSARDLTAEKKTVQGYIASIRAKGDPVGARAGRIKAYEEEIRQIDGELANIREGKIRGSVRKAFPPKPGAEKPLDPKAKKKKPGGKELPKLGDVLGGGKQIPGQPADPSPPGAGGQAPDSSQVPTPGAPTQPVAPGKPSPAPAAPAAGQPVGKPGAIGAGLNLSPTPGAPPLGPGSAPGARPQVAPAAPKKKPVAAPPQKPGLDPKKQNIADQIKGKGQPPSGGKPF